MNFDDLNMKKDDDKKVQLLHERDIQPDHLTIDLKM